MNTIGGSNFGLASNYSTVAHGIPLHNAYSNTLNKNAFKSTSSMNVSAKDQMSQQVSHQTSKASRDSSVGHNKTPGHTGSNQILPGTLKNVQANPKMF